jgi:hypothetical protein
MVVESATFIRDVLFFIKNDLLTNITDPIVSKRSGSSGWVMTSYPQKLVQYPLITIKMTNFNGTRAGMQTNAMDVTLNLEIRIWGRDQKEKDTLGNSVYKRLRDIQFTTTTGSIANSLNGFTLLSATEVDEPGEDQPKSRILQIKYNFYDI